MTRPALPRRSRQRGIAVIMAMLVVTIATVLAIEMAWHTNLDIRRTAGLISWDQAHEFAFGAEAFASRLLADKFQDEAGDTPLYSRSDDEQACTGFQFQLDQGAMTGGVCDLQGKFNLNNLVNGAGKPDPLVVKQFRRLLEAVGSINEDIKIDPVEVRFCFRAR